jgi:hypothetical protein
VPAAAEFVIVVLEGGGLGLLEGCDGPALARSAAAAWCSSMGGLPGVL